MAEPYPIALRERVVEAYERGEGSYAKVAAKFRLGEATVRRWVSRFRDVGHVKPHKKKGGGRRSDISVKELEAILDKLDDPTAGEITASTVGDQRASELFSTELLEHVSGVREPSKQAEPENGQPLLAARAKQPTAV